MGGCTSAHNVEVGPPTSSPAKYVVEPISVPERFVGVKRGMRLFCLDSFVSKYTGETMFKWREAEIKVYDGSSKSTKCLVHYVGWSDKYDKWIDLASDEIEQLCPMEVMSIEQQEAGGAIGKAQRKLVMEFFETGKEPTEMVVATTRKGLTSSPQQQPARSESDPTDSNNDAAYSGPLYKGLKVDVQDVFTRKDSGVVTHSKWRVAEILDVIGSKVRVHYDRLGHDFDEVLDIKKEGYRIRKAGEMSSHGTLRKSKSMGSHSRLARRSFDSSIGKSGLSLTSEWDESLQSSISSPMGSPVTSLNSWSNFQTDSPSDDLENSPAFLLRNKEAPISTGGGKREGRTLSFTSKTGKVVPGAAVGMHSSGSKDKRRHSSSGLQILPLASREIAFADRMESIGLHIVPIEPDGNCLFRAISHQIYCHERQHIQLRKQCVTHMQEHRERFEIFCTSDFDAHCRRMALDGTWASELEIRAMEEIIDRVFSIYSSEDKSSSPAPMNTNFDELQLVGLDVTSVKLSYHGNHYNSVFDQKKEFPLGEIKNKKVILNMRVKLFHGN